MAIQNRRGVYSNFDPSKMVPGEFAVVQSGDSNTLDGKAVYIAFKASDVKRLVTSDELAQVSANASDALTKANNAVTQASTAAANASNALTKANTATSQASNASNAASNALSKATASETKVNNLQDKLSYMPVDGTNIFSVWDAGAGQGATISRNSKIITVEHTAAYHGVFIPTKYFAVGETYELSFKFKKVSGELSCIGGDRSGKVQKYFAVDGVEQTCDFHNTSGLATVADDTNEHTVDFIFTAETTASVHVQANRGKTTQVTWQIYGIVLKHIPTDVVTDGTLTQTGRAADAKAVGDALASATGDLSGDITALEAALDDNMRSIVGAVSMQFQPGVRNCSTIGNVIGSPTLTDDKYVHALAPCTSSDVVIVNVRGASGARAWAYLDADYKVLQNGEANTSYRDVQLPTPPDNTAYVLLNNRTGESYIPTGYYGHIGRTVDERIDAVATEAEQTTPGFNMGPFFSHDLEDKYDAATNPDGYWYGIHTNTYTRLEDGWVHVHYDNSTGTTRNARNALPRPTAGVKPGADYTWLFEFRNNASEGCNTGNSLVYIVQDSSPTQFWGSTIKENLEGEGTNSGARLDQIPTDGTVYRHRFIKTAEAEDSSYYLPAPIETCLLRTYVEAGGIADFDMRVSLYEGKYMGDYVPYTLSVDDAIGLALESANVAKNTADAAQTTAEEAKTTADAAKTTADKAKADVAALNLTEADDVCALWDGLRTLDEGKVWKGTVGTAPFTISITRGEAPLFVTVTWTKSSEEQMAVYIAVNDMVICLADTSNGDISCTAAFNSSTRMTDYTFTLDHADHNTARWVYLKLDQYGLAP